MFTLYAYVFRLVNVICDFECTYSLILWITGYCFVDNIHSFWRKAMEIAICNCDCEDSLCIFRNFLKAASLFGVFFRYF